MVSKARLDLPLPLSPVMTMSRSRGRERSKPLRLCSRAPWMSMRSWGMPDLAYPVEAWAQARGATSHRPRPPAGRGGATAAAIGSHLVLVHDLVPGEATALYPVAWTLGIEALFYLAVPAAAVAAARRLRGRPARPRTVALAIVGLWAASAGFSAVVG